MFVHTCDKHLVIARAQNRNTFWKKKEHTGKEKKNEEKGNNIRSVEVMFL